MSQQWVLIHDLLGGTERMRDAGVVWLPREPKEKLQAWRNRRDRSILFNAYKNTVKTLSARPFCVPTTIEEALPEQLITLPDDVDRERTDLTQFLRGCMEDGLNYGKGHILVDHPPQQDLNLLQQRQLNVRPYFARISPRDLISWRVEKLRQGGQRLTQIRYREQRVEEEGRWGDREVEYVRVYEPDHWELWRKERNGQFVQLSPEEGGEGPNTLGKIPLVTFYFTNTGFFTAEPPLEDLAWLNLRHWQSYSDQANILRFARVGMYYATGITKEEFDAGFTVGANQVFKSTSDSAKFGTVELSGQAIESGRNDLKDVEARMEIEGLRPFIERTQAVKATGIVASEDKSTSNIQCWVRSLERAAMQAFELAAEWTKTELKPETKVNIFSDFGITLQGQQDAAELLKMWQSGAISHETLLHEIKRRGVLSDAVNVDSELERVESSGPNLAMIGDEDEEEEDEGADAA